MLDRTGDAIRRLRDVLDRVIFLPSPPETLRFKGWEGVVVPFSFLALAIVLQMLRIGPSSALHSLWAEDGPVFLEKAMTHDFLSTLTTPWSEYLVVTQGLIGEVGALVPLRDAPAAMNLTAAVMVALTVLVPVSSIETVASPSVGLILLTGFSTPAIFFFVPVALTR